MTWLDAYALETSHLKDSRGRHSDSAEFFLKSPNPSIWFSTGRKLLIAQRDIQRHFMRQGV